MMLSLRAKLLGLIFFSTVVVWAAAAYWGFFDTRREINDLFDAHLAESARAILQQAEGERREFGKATRWKGGDDEDDANELESNAVKSESVENESTLKDFDDSDFDDNVFDNNDFDDEGFHLAELSKRGVLFEKRLHFQIWNQFGNLLAGSTREPGVAVLAGSASAGFSQGRYRDDEIRVFSAWNKEKTLNVQVGESIKKRNDLVTTSVKTVLKPILIMIFPLLFCIGLIDEYALKPIVTLAREVENRTPDNLQPIDDKLVPNEILPITKALTLLFLKVARALANEQRFTADAAHELRTPLAAIKVQAQVAQRSGDDPVVRSRALKGVSLGVDRATHLVEQLLTMARLDPQNDLRATPVLLRALLMEVANSFAISFHQEEHSSKLGTDPQKNLDVKVETGSEFEVLGNFSMLEILLRNLFDNAVRYTPAQAVVRASVNQWRQGVRIIVEDNGPGLSEEQSKMVTQRFSRMQWPSGEGSGLGLSIVSRIVELHHAKLVFARSETLGGCRVEVLFTGDVSNQ